MLLSIIIYISLNKIIAKETKHNENPSIEKFYCGFVIESKTKYYRIHVSRNDTIKTYSLNGMKHILIQICLSCFVIRRYMELTNWVLLAVLWQWVGRAHLEYCTTGNARSVLGCVCHFMCTFVLQHNNNIYVHIIVVPMLFEVKNSITKYLCGFPMMYMNSKLLELTRLIWANDREEFSAASLE